MLHSIQLLVILLLIFSWSGFAQKPEITGKWYFDRFGGPHGEIDKDPSTLSANKHNEGLTMTFTMDNKMIGVRTGGSEPDTFKSTFQLLNAGKLIAIKHLDTMRIMLLTSDILELYPTSGTKPAMFLKRSKNGKTSMSAPNR